MTDKDRQPQPDKYIQCSRCACKYINDYDHIKSDFGYNRLEERYKTCNKCRNKTKVYEDKDPEKRRQYRQTYNNKHREKINAYNYEKIECKSCGHKVCRNAMRQHGNEKGCIN